MPSDPPGSGARPAGGLAYGINVQDVQNKEEARFAHIEMKDFCKNGCFSRRWEESEKWV